MTTLEQAKQEAAELEAKAEEAQAKAAEARARLKRLEERPKFYRHGNTGKDTYFSTLGQAGATLWEDGSVTTWDSAGIDISHYIEIPESEFLSAVLPALRKFVADVIPGAEIVVMDDGWPTPEEVAEKVVADYWESPERTATFLLEYIPDLIRRERARKASQVDAAARRLADAYLAMMDCSLKDRSRSSEETVRFQLSVENYRRILADEQGRRAEGK